MVGPDATRYHSQLHGAVHYTDSITLHHATSAAWMQGSAEDDAASRERPFQGHMFIQGCVSAIGWLNSEGTCVRLAKNKPPCRGVSICGDHMQGHLHYSHITLTDNDNYDFRNAEVSFDLDKQTYKTVVCNFDRPFARALHINPQKIKPGCVSTMRIQVPKEAKGGSVKLTFHPDLVWLTNRPRLISRGFIGILSFESYGHRTEDVVCSYKEQCFEFCDETLHCAESGLSGIDTFDGTETDAPSGLNYTNSTSGCWAPLQFEPWVDDCGKTHTYELSTGQSITYYYNFDDYHTGETGTRLWKWDRSDKQNPVGESYITGPNVNRFNFKITPLDVPNRNRPPLPALSAAKGNYISRENRINPDTVIYDTLSADMYGDDHVVQYIEQEDVYITTFTRDQGTRYLFTLRCPDDQPLVRGRFKVSCPELVIRYRYYPKY